METIPAVLNLFFFRGKNVWRERRKGYGGTKTVHGRVVLRGGEY